MKMKPFHAVGGRRVMYIPDWIKTSIRIVNHSRVRSYSVFTHQTRSTYHDTGNPRTGAEAEYNWLAGGRQGGVVGGYQWIFDDKILIQCGVLNERSWHAGSPRGNESFGAEHAFGGSTNWNQSLEIGCALHGALIEMQGLTTATAAVLHQFWTGKYCSAQILNRGIWNWVKSKIAAYAAASAAARKAAGSGGGTVDVPVAPVVSTPEPVRLPDGTRWDGKEDVVINGIKFEGQRATGTVTAALRMRKWASTEAPQSGPGYAANSKVNLLGWVAGELVSGVSEWWIDEHGHRLWGGAIDVEPKKDPEFGQKPDDVPGMEIINGRLYYKLYDLDTGEWGRKINIARAGNLRKWADPASEATGSVVPGTEITFKWWTRGTPIPLSQNGPDENIWFAKELHSGDRMWSGLSSERPQ